MRTFSDFTKKIVALHSKVMSLRKNNLKFMICIKKLTELITFI